MNKAYDRRLYTRLPGTSHLGSRANNIYPLGSDKLTEVQLYMSTSCQPDNWLIRAYSDMEKPFQKQGRRSIFKIIFCKLC